ncbi:MAG: UDP-3-O-[3-hydroxymyristoyl] N-acetylglucosamine deacetylase [Deltaproteobacteria bacterium]|uniref:UDP-3-O-acyl-N-acetylglucosamine deacetylase n=1 Tax=Candidatus Zymogenus saltonus TaxID=2844893 RepID=A0A9D8KE99_9DELT|nr:UDP-3-O-[3-hydroxymyristoyl] N-acetylglucosamine deacetylase [Candidatus Zymogenus saltonus]
MYKNLYQRGIEREASTTSVGIHTGSPVTVTLKPAAPGYGIAFIARDGAEPVRIPAHFSMVKNTMLATTLTSGDVSISTVEHLMAVLSVFGVDNVNVHVNGPELPVLDGSAVGYISLLNSAGVMDYAERRRFARVTGKVGVESGGGLAVLSPWDGGLYIDYTIVYENPHVGTQRLEFEVTADYFDKEIAPARTYGLLEDVESMHERGLALGGTLENALVISDKGVLNPDGLRFPDECVRHKCLDALGDLALFGMPIIGKFTAYKSGHKLNHLLLKELAKTGRYEVVEGAVD